MATNHSQTLAGAAPAEGIVEIRKSVIIAILLVVGLFAGLVLWLMRSSHPVIAPATAQTFGTLHSSDVSTLDENATKHTDALATAPPVAVNRPAGQPALDTSLIDAAPPPPQAEQPSQATQPTQITEPILPPYGVGKRSKARATRIWTSSSAIAIGSIAQRASPRRRFR